MNDRGVVAEFSFDVPSSTWTWSQGLYDLHGLDVAVEPTTDHLLRPMHAEDLPVMEERLERQLSRPGPYTCVYRMTDAAGRTRQIRLVGNAVREGEDVARLDGFVLDVTEDVRAWQSSAIDAVLEHRATIEQAKGALMLAFHIDEDDAFDLLRSFSMNQNEKLWTVAERLTRTIRDRNADEDPVRLLRQLLPVDPNESPERPRRRDAG